MKNKIIIEEDFIRMDHLMKLVGMVSSGGEAKHVIQNGDVKFNGEVCIMRGKKVRVGDTVEFDNQTILIVSKENELQAR